jgi:ribosome recycling factor
MDEVFALAKEKMEKTLKALHNEFASMRSGRASAAVLDKIMVDYYGVPTPIQQMAAISVQEGRILVIQPWDTSTIQPIEKAIQASDLGINPMNDGKVIRLTFPPLTEDRRKEIVKDVSKIAEGTKVQIRNVRRDAIDDLKKLKKSGGLTEDDLKDGEKEMQKLTDKFIKQTDSICADKKKEIMEL